MPTLTELYLDEYTPEEKAYLEAPMGEKQLEVGEAIDKLQVPLLTALYEEYGEQRGWMVCGPATILLANFVSALTDLPLVYGKNEGERIDLSIGIYKSPEGKHIEHTYMRYFSDVVPDGRRLDEEIMFVDLVGDLLWEGQTLTDPVRAELRKRYRLGKTLRQLFHIYPFSERLAAELNIDIWEDGHPTTMEEYTDVLSVMHDSRVFQDTLVTDSGRFRDASPYWGTKLLRTAYATLGKIPTGTLDTAKIKAKLPPLPRTAQVQKRR